MFYFVVKLHYVMILYAQWVSLSESESVPVPVSASVSIYLVCVL